MLRTVSPIAIVGGAGFVGSRLATALREDGRRVVVVDIAPPGDSAEEYRQADVRDAAGLRAALEGCDAVYNLAAVHRDDIKPASVYDSVNVAGAYNVCEACRRLGINRLVLTSSVAVYGRAAQGATEEEQPAPVAPYGKSKLRAEQVHREWQQESAHVRSLVTVRPTVVFGEGNRGNVYQLLRQITSGRFLMVGSGENRKSMAYVGNLGAFLVRVLTLRPGAHVFNYVDKPDLSMSQLVDIVAEAAGTRHMDWLRIPYPVGYLGGMLCDVAAAVTGRSFPVSAVRVRKFCSTTTFSAQRLRSTGFQPALGLREALVRTVRHEIAADDASIVALSD